MAYDRELATAQIDSLVKSLSEKTLDKWKDTFERQTPTWLTSRRFDGGSRTRSEPTERRLFCLDDGGRITNTASLHLSYAAEELGECQFQLLLVSAARSGTARSNLLLANAWLRTLHWHDVQPTYALRPDPGDERQQLTTSSGVSDKY